MPYLTTRLHVSRTTLLFNEYLLINLSLRMATASAMSLTPYVTYTKKIGEDRTCSYEDMIEDRQTDRNAHHNTPRSPIGGGVIITNCYSRPVASRQVAPA